MLKIARFFVGFAGLSFLYVYLTVLGLFKLPHDIYRYTTEDVSYPFFGRLVNFPSAKTPIAPPKTVFGNVVK